MALCVRRVAPAKQDLGRGACAVCRRRCRCRSRRPVGQYYAYAIAEVMEKQVFVSRRSLMPGQPASRG